MQAQVSLARGDGAGPAAHDRREERGPIQLPCLAQARRGEPTQQTGSGTSWKPMALLFLDICKVRADVPPRRPVHGN
jgi:hypothetical protein